MWNWLYLYAYTRYGLQRFVSNVIYYIFVSSSIFIGFGFFVIFALGFCVCLLRARAGTNFIGARSQYFPFAKLLFRKNSTRLCNTQNRDQQQQQKRRNNNAKPIHTYCEFTIGHIANDVFQFAINKREKEIVFLLLLSFAFAVSRCDFFNSIPFQRHFLLSLSHSCSLALHPPILLMLRLAEVQFKWCQRCKHKY